MRRVASLPVLLIMASVVSTASVATFGQRAQIKDRITSTSALPHVVKRLSPERNATQPPLPRFNPDPTPVITEFYGPARSEAKKPEPKAAPAAVPEAAVRTHTPSAQ